MATMRQLRNRPESGFSLRSKPYFDYCLDGLISQSQSEKDIGVTIDQELKFTVHYAEKVNKANKILDIIRRTFTTLNIDIFKPLYLALIRPRLEYMSQV